ncbi:hypothetical protein L7F22_007128 [Adiantum nelumboides]|nr:hypothetical protein [Adiantum nelumboides]
MVIFVKASSVPLEIDALLHFKDQIQQDPSHSLASWTSSSSSPCNWVGIECDSTAHVQSISLPDLNLAGTLSFSFWLAHLSSLQTLDLSGNQFTGNLSSILPRTCTALQVLNLAGNYFSGGLLATLLSGCGSIRSLNLSNNALSGDIPSNFLFGCNELGVLDLSRNKITGGLSAVSTSICPSLLHVHLARNLIGGSLPPTLLSNCSLLSLDLSNNKIYSSVPEDFFATCSALISVDLSSNALFGQLPSSLQVCTNMASLNLTNNQFSSKVPDFLGKLTKIGKLHIGNNNLVGSLPDNVISNLCSTLVNLDMAGNNLTGALPTSLATCTKLQVLNLANNKLNGDLPNEVISGLQAMEVLRLDFNAFTGSIEATLMNCSKLRILDLSANFLTGNIPEEMCPPSNSYVLEQLLLANNQISGTIPSSLMNCLHLNILDLSFNKLTGNIPSQLSYLHTLERLSLWYNQLSGDIPKELGNLTMLRSLNLNNNFLTGQVPAELSQCGELEWINLNSNLLTGTIPAEFGHLQKLTLLQLGNNTLTGTIPPNLANCSQLLWVDFNANLLTGSIPAALGRHSTTSLPNPVLNGNRLAYMRNLVSSCKGFGMGIMLDYTGITEEALATTPFMSACQGSGSKPIIYVGGSLYDNPENRTIQYLDLSFNQLSGSIPEEMGSWLSLISLALSHNQLTGKLPASFRNLHALGVMDISYNHLEGSLAVLSECTLLVAVDVSNNFFAGEIPAGQLSTNPAQSFAHNLGLCGPPLGPCIATSPSSLSSCSSGSSNCQNKEERLNILSMANSIVLAVLVALLCMSAFLVWVGMTVKSKNKKKEQALLSSLNQSSSNGGSSSWNLSGEREPLSINVATFERPLRKLTFSQLIEATNGFSKESMVGTGGFGEVYRAELRDGTVVAIKKLIQFSYQGDREFTAEMETLGKIKHRNLVPLLGYCKVGEERLLVYEYMQGGSLEEVLHGGKEGRERVTWDIRKQIAKGAARGLAFLHHNCIPHIIHRDMKSSNVLLDRDWEARVSDFGMARLISALDTHLSVSTLAGTPGYVPPEYYQSFRCTTKGDIYSFGVILLELVTGQRPTHKEEFGDNNLVGWVKQHVSSNNCLDVLDPVLRGTGAEFEMMHYLKIACDCLDELPSRRPSMLRVVAMLKELAFDDQNSTSCYQHSS